MEGQEKREPLKATLFIELRDEDGNMIDSRCRDEIVQGAESVHLMLDLDTVVERRSISLIAIGRREVCVNCDGIEGSGFLYCPIYETMTENFGGNADNCFCPFFARDERTADTDAEEQAQVSPEAPAEAISEPVSGSISGSISEPSSEPEIRAEIPKAPGFEPTNEPCPDCGEMLDATPDGNRYCASCGEMIVDWREPQPTPKDLPFPCARCGSAAHAFYAIPAISETHLCADCVLDRMSTDPSAEEVMQYVTREGDDHPYAARFIYEARKNSGHYSY